MSGTSSSTQGTQQSQQSTTNPYAAAVPALTSLLGGITSAMPGATTPNAATTGAFNTLAQNAAQTPNLTPQSNAYMQQLISGTPNFGTGAQTATDSASGALNPYLQSGYLDPMSTPGLSADLTAVQNQVGNSINAQFAGAGRDMSPANSTAAAYGETQAIAPIITGQYNANVAAQQNAANSLSGIQNSNAALQSGLYQTGLTNTGTGFTYDTSMAPTVANMGATNTINAANAPLTNSANNLGLLEGLTVPIAGLGSSSTGTGTSTSQGTQTMSPFQMAMMGLTAGTSAAKQLLPSDRRVKDNIVQVGAMFDGTPVYRYNYKGNGVTHIGLMAQEVEQYAPDAVEEHFGIKHVNYIAATRRAVEMGAR